MANGFEAALGSDGARNGLLDFVGGAVAKISLFGAGLGAEDGPKLSRSIKSSIFEFVAVGGDTCWGGSGIT